MAVTASELRQNVYKLLDQVLETGVPLEIERKGKLLRVAVADTRGRLQRLTPHSDAIVGDPEDLVHIDWLAEWNPQL